MIQQNSQLGRGNPDSYIALYAEGQVLPVNETECDKCYNYQDLAITLHLIVHAGFKTVAIWKVYKKSNS